MNSTTLSVDNVSARSYRSGAPLANCMQFEMGDITFWFSYQTCIAFLAGTDFFMRENNWGPTTGRHMNDVPFGSSVTTKRLQWREFDAALRRVKVSFLPSDVSGLEPQIGG